MKNRGTTSESLASYNRETLRAYCNPERAVAYQRYHSSWTWGRIMMWLQLHAVERELKRYSWTSSDRLLDIPCGTGVLGGLLRRFPFLITASDISPEMMALARDEYPRGRLDECIRADITSTPFPRGYFACVVTLGFLHRVPWEIKRATLREIAALSNRVVIISCSVDSVSQRLKNALMARLKPHHKPAPCPVPLKEIIAECQAQGLRVVRAYKILPLLSAHALLVLEKEASKTAP